MYELVAFLIILLHPLRILATDICELQQDAGVYCSCDYRASGAVDRINCYVYGSVEPSTWEGFKIYQGLPSLSISSRLETRLPELPKPVLNHLPFLESLEVQEANITTLKSGLIAGLQHLIQLKLERDEIQNLEPSAIWDLPALQQLHLSGNLISEVHSGVLGKLPSLSKLYLDQNRISHIDDCAFCDLTSLRELELWNNRITTLRSGMFAKLGNLSRLDLYINNIEAIEDGTFADLVSLREMDMRNNSIRTIGPRGFSGLKNLLTLMLNNNKLTALPDQVFDDTPNLRLIDLSHNLLKTLQHPVIQNLAHLLEPEFNFFFKDNPLECTCQLEWVRDIVDQVESISFRHELRRLKCRIVEGHIPLENATAVGKTVKFAHIELGCPLEPQPPRIPTSTDAQEKTNPPKSEMATPPPPSIEGKEADGSSPAEAANAASTSTTEQSSVDKIKGSFQYAEEQKSVPDAGSVLRIHSTWLAFAVALSGPLLAVLMG